MLSERELLSEPRVNKDSNIVTTYLPPGWLVPSSARGQVQVERDAEKTKHTSLIIRREKFIYFLSVKLRIRDVI